MNTTDLLISEDKLRTILEHTDGYCPCVPKFARAEDTKCQCKTYREEGHCCCGYFREINRKQSDKTV